MSEAVELVPIAARGLLLSIRATSALSMAAILNCGV